MPTIAQAGVFEHLFGWLLNWLPAPVRSSSGILIAANLLPLYGVIAWDWSVFHVMALYWAENVIAGIYTLLRMIVASPLAGIPLGAFFCLHYGMFCSVHGLFVNALFNPDKAQGELEAWGLVQVLLSTPQLLFAVGLLLLSHGWSFVAHFVNAPRAGAAAVGEIMMRPYARMALLHVTIIFGGFLVMSTGTPVLALVFLIVIKTVADLKLHTRANLSEPAADEAVVEASAPEAAPGTLPEAPSAPAAAAFRPSVPLAEIADAPDIPASGARPFQINSGNTPDAKS